MVRLVTTVLALAILPGFAVAQEPAPDAYLVHVVVPGNTLWDLAERYYGDAFAWPRIHEANRSQILNPDLICPEQQFQIPDIPQPDATAVALIDWTPTLICPGQELMIPVTDGSEDVVAGAAGPEDVVPGPEVDAEAAPGVVSDVVVTTPDVGPPPAEARVVRRGMSRDRRSVFYRDPNASSVAQLAEEEDYLLFSRASVWSAEWLGPEVAAEVQSSGRVRSFVAQGQRTGIPYTQVRLTLEPGARVRLGDALQIFRPVRTVKGLGTIFRPTGVLSVTRIDASSVEGVVLQSFDRVRLGDQIRPAPAFDLVPGQVPRAVARRTSATIIEFGGVHELYGPHEVVMIDKGAADGVDVGDEYVAFAGDGVTEQAVARLRVVLTENSTSSARIVDMVEPVFQIGSEVHLDRKMR